MKKLLPFFCLIIPGLAHAAFFPPVLTPTGVTASTVAVVNGASAFTATVTQGTAANLKVDLSGTSANATAIKVDGSAVTQPVNIGNTAFAITTTTFNGTAQPVNIANTVFAVSTVTFNGTSQPVNLTGTALAITTVTFNGSSQPVTTLSTITVQGSAASGGSASGNPLQSGVLVASSTLNTQQTDAKMTYQASDSYGRTIIQGGVPLGMLKFSTATLTNTTATVLISSPAAGNFNVVCGCVVTNTSATNTFVTLAGAALTSQANTVSFGTPANDIPAGIWPGCDNPIIRSGVSGNAIQIQANASVSSLLVSCEYYVSP